MKPTNGSRQYLQNAVLTAQPEQLQLMLLDGAVKFALRGRDAILARQHEEAFNQLDRAQRICLQLGAGLNRDANPAVAEQMEALYQFCYRRLIDANLQKEVGPVDDAVRILKHQRETWAIIAEKIGQLRIADAAANSTSTAASDGRAGGSQSTMTKPSQQPTLRLADDEPEAGSLNLEG